MWGFGWIIMKLFYRHPFFGYTSEFSNYWEIYWKAAFLKNIRSLVSRIQVCHNLSFSTQNGRLYSAPRRVDYTWPPRCDTWHLVFCSRKQRCASASEVEVRFRSLSITSPARYKLSYVVTANIRWTVLTLPVIFKTCLIFLAAQTGISKGGLYRKKKIA